MKPTKKIMILAAVLLAFVLLYFWIGHIFDHQMLQGDEALAARKYSLAYVYYQKAAMLKPQNQTARSRQNLAKAAAENVLAMRDFLVDEKKNDLLALIDKSNSKVCDLESDRTLIENDMPEVAKINLEFCAKEGPKDYQSWIFLGLANMRLSESSREFKELKPGFRQNATDAFSQAYLKDPVNKSAIEYSIEVNKLAGNQPEVDRWQKLLDSLNKISQ